MPSRRKSAHTTKIERVPRYEVYHGEEDIDERCGEDGTLDLSMKRIKVEPPDYDESSNASELVGQSKKTKLVESASKPAVTDAGNARSSGGDVTTKHDQMNKSSASSPVRQAESIAESRESGSGASVADDTAVSTTGDHVTARVALSAPIVYTTANGQFFTDSNVQKASAVTGQPLFPQSKGRSMRPFKLYTSNCDLLAGLATQGAPTLAAYSVPIALAAAPGAVPLAFASMPVVTGAPMIPVTASTIISTTATSSAAMGAGTDATSSSSTSAAATTTTAKSTSSTTDVHLMTLATEADKILRERHASGESTDRNSDMNDSAMEGDTAEDLSSNGDLAVAEDAASEDGTVLKIPSLSGKTTNGSDETLTLIHKRAVAAAVAASSPHKSKKKRQTLPEEMKDNAYWERRRKNNEAAKRSRDARRAKEDQIAIRAALLEQENIRLKIEVASLKEETAKLRSMLYSNNNS